MLKLTVYAVGQRPPEWVKTAVADYVGRLKHPFQLEFVEIPPKKRTASADTQQIAQQEWAKIAEKLPADAFVIALDERGDQVTSQQLAKKMDAWQLQGQPVALVIGGADGLAPEALKRANWRWSLSQLTLPHMLVRVVLAEQMYRAYAILQNHPYHRE